MREPYTQSEHDDAVGIGCMIILAILSPFVIAAAAILGMALQSLFSMLLAALVAVQ